MYNENWRRIVVKLGSSTLTHENGRLNIRLVENLVKVLSDIKNSGREVLIVSSGAIAMGLGKLNLGKKPNALGDKQACASIGQCELMYVYDKYFSEYDHNVGQVLLTAEDFRHAQRKKNIANTIESLIGFGVIPVINENDTVSTSEILSIGDNDNLAAQISICAEVDLLVLLTDIRGLYTSDPNIDPDARFISLVEKLDDATLECAGGASSTQGTGGMTTKLQAARACMNNNIDMVISKGDQPENLYDLLDGKNIGTLFKGN
ncbi:MAG: glutamate 5-kinase [Eggerthellaceae bacterium]|nr:glutamate 5-kinase [Eggerthellaceae bacterium]